ncbi:hypothetical protein DFJ67_0033 [Asanoa ferruginea]|uniref:Uncharacterized protein n=1 Tax=Asanoa ferruginea TaxID=53367 RepID=A0A3D9ZE64_9ACTN|nr:hypothetical protein [Asanoa ferruginea]REF94123.1 hypothetical protein DFJ67_0033 [Asanoa ferruginea]GIF52586.1 hypothetical protein Afe04nite_71250 [Asanoa ferruginea]
MTGSDETVRSLTHVLRTFFHRRDTLIAALEAAVAAYGEELDEVAAAHKAGLEYALRMVRQFLDLDVNDIPGLDPSR